MSLAKFQNMFNTYGKKEEKAVQVEEELPSVEGMTLEQIIQSDVLIKSFRKRYGFDKASVRENVSCPKIGFAWRSKRDCLSCDKKEVGCIMPIVDNPFSKNNTGGEPC